MAVAEASTHRLELLGEETELLKVQEPRVIDVHLVRLRPRLRVRVRIRVRVRVRLRVRLTAYGLRIRLG